MSGIDWRSMFKGVLSRMRDAGESHEMGARWMATEADAAVCDLIKTLTSERDRLREENEMMRKALEFYANPEIYKPHPHGPAFDRRDLSYHAKVALKGGAA